MNPIKPTKYEELYTGDTREIELANYPGFDILPALLSVNPSALSTNTLTTEWVPSAEELHRLSTGGHVRLRVLIYDEGETLQPMNVDVVGGDLEGPASVTRMEIEES